MQKHFNCHNNCNLELREEGATMKFKSYKHMLERPFIVYCDFECSLIQTDMSDKIALHAPNSAAAYFVCTFDHSRNQYYKFERKGLCPKHVKATSFVRNPLCKGTAREHQDGTNSRRREELQESEGLLHMQWSLHRNKQKSKRPLPPNGQLPRGRTQRLQHQLF